MKIYCVLFEPQSVIWFQNWVQVIFNLAKHNWFQAFFCHWFSCLWAKLFFLDLLDQCWSWWVSFWLSSESSCVRSQTVTTMETAMGERTERKSGKLVFYHPLPWNKLSTLNNVEKSNLHFWFMSCFQICFSFT